jgi:acyl-CoA reductase-like NAD-dependent aldehyde dehydrogenase
MIREAAALTTQIGGEVIPSDKPGCLAMALREPVGAVLGIAPWNAPIILGVRAIAVPLACGNSVILKASEICPRTHALIIEAFAEAGFPAGVVNVVTNAPKDAGEVVGALIDHPAVKRINFTGSTGVGRIIAKRCRKPQALPAGAGWQGALIVLDDADLDDAVKAAAFGAFMNQDRSACPRNASLWWMPSPQNSTSVLQPRRRRCRRAIHVRARRRWVQWWTARLLRTSMLIDDATAKGAKLIAGGKAETSSCRPR